MAEPLKNRYNQAFFQNLAKAFQAQGHLRDEQSFFSKIFDENWEEKELKDRMRHITVVLHAELDLPYGEALEVLKAVAAQQEPDFLPMFFPDFVEVYGLEEDWEMSMEALAHFTRYSSSEFAVRPFILQDRARMMAQMQIWARHANHHVRRLASEGCRPRLPWAMALPAFKRDPSPILPILETLKADPSAYVRRSVANNLNDIAKDHPALVLEVAERWWGESKETDWIVKHACRTLLKKGHPRAMRLFGFGDPAVVTISTLQTVPQSVAIGGEMHFSFVLKHQGDEALQLRLEYGVDYMKANGKHSRKVFMIKEGQFPPGEHSLKRKQSFRNLTTRKHYPGPHGLVVIVNGVEKAQLEFEVLSSA